MAQSPLKNVPFVNWPVPETHYQTLYLSNNHRLADTSPTVQTSASLQADAPRQQIDAEPEELLFEHTFISTTMLVGASKAIFYMSCPDHDDFDVFVQLRNADASSRILQKCNIPIGELGVSSFADVDEVSTLRYLGPSGWLRASHRAIDPELSKSHWPAHDHTRGDKIESREVVELTTGLWATAMQFEAGEKLVLKVTGHSMTLA